MESKILITVACRDNSVHLSAGKCLIVLGNYRTKTEAAKGLRRAKSRWKKADVSLKMLVLVAVLNAMGLEDEVRMECVQNIVRHTKELV